MIGEWDTTPREGWFCVASSASLIRWAAMHIDRSSFLILVGTLAVGAAGGYTASARRVFPGLDHYFGRKPEPQPEPPPPVAKDAAPPIASVAPPPPPPAAPPCDDSGGATAECPPPGFPTVEGGCGSFAHTRCGEFKQSMKPKVAQAAIECLNKLKPKERCEASRVNLCGHLALMNACPEANATSATNDAGPAKGPVASACETILAACGPSPIAPSATECKQALSGLTDHGRESVVACMRTHCFDKGLLGCEAAAASTK